MREIQNDFARDFLIQAENAMQQKKYTEALAWATAALGAVLSMVKQDVRNSMSVNLDEITTCYYLGIDIDQYFRYRNMAGYWGVPATFSSNGTILHGKVFKLSGSHFDNFHKRIKLQFDKKEAEISLNYCVKTIISIQETLKRRNKPFGDE